MKNKIKYSNFVIMVFNFFQFQYSTAIPPALPLATAAVVAVVEVEEEVSMQLIVLFYLVLLSVI